MLNLVHTAIPVVIQFGGATVFSGEVYLAALLAALTSRPDASRKIYKSVGLSVEQMQQLLTKVDPKTVVFLKRIAENGGSITFAEMRQIFGIQDWTGFSSRFGKGLTKALRHMTGDASATLIWWIDEEWAVDDDPEGEVYLDGPALESLRVLVGQV